MNIGISCYATHGGSGVVATELGKALAERGHKIHFISTSVPFRLLGQFHENIFLHEVEMTHYPVLQSPPFELALASKMAEVIEYANLDILHCHYAVPHAVAAFLAREMLSDRHVKVVTTLHGTDITVLAENRSLRNVIRLGINRSDAVTAVSDSLVRQTEELFSTLCPIQRIHNFIDPSLYRRTDGTKLRKCVAKPDEKIVMHISNFREVKRVPDVVRIFAKVREKLNSRLLLVGEGPELSNTRQLVRELDIEPYVSFLGKQDDIPGILSLADVFLLPSEKESFGLVALEAMACGVPVVGSTAGGIPEVVQHGVTGFLAPIGDVEKMARYTIHLLSNDNLRQQFVQAAGRKIASDFLLEDRVIDYEQLYERLLAGEYCS